MPNSAWYRTLDLLAKSAVVGLALAFVIVFFRPDLLSQRDGADSWAQAVDRSAPSVVNIHTATEVDTPRSDILPDELWQRFFADVPGLHQERIESSLGSGVIVSEEGHILTSHHVIADADEIRVALHDDQIAAADIVGVDPETDLALLRIEGENLPAIEFGSSDRIRVGDVVLAIGNPVGLGQAVTQGIVSATGRSQLGITTFENFIQTDAAINFGNSGGALVDTRGRLVGINTAMLAGENAGQGLGFAIPVNLARGVKAELIEHGRVIRGYLGVSPQNITRDLAESFGMDEARGVLVVQVQSGSPAEEAEMESGDVILEVDGNSVSDPYDLLNKIAALRPGDRAELTVWRNGETLSISVIIGERRVSG